MNHNSAPIYPTPEARDEALQADIDLTEAGLPYSGARIYPHETARQVDLAAAERANIAQTAGEVGMTSTEWLAKREELGRSPNSRGN